MMENYKICLLGACRNAEPFLPQVLSNLDTIASWFKECRIVIYENDSTDRTHELLDTWKNVPTHATHRHVVIGSKLDTRFPHRTERLAFIRNTLLCHIPPDFDYFMMLDMDDVFLHPVEKESFDSCFAMKEKWDVVTANGYNAYYDIWTLRIPGVIEFDCWWKFRELMDSGKYTKEQAVYEAVSKFNTYMNNVTEPMYVDSAFNVGMISKVSAVRPCCRYGGTADGRECSDHIPFQRCLRSHGVRILFNPDFRL